MAVRVGFCAALTGLATVKPQLACVGVQKGCDGRRRVVTCGGAVARCG